MNRYTHPETGIQHDLESGTRLTPCCGTFSTIDSVEDGFYHNG